VNLDNSVERNILKKLYTLLLLLILIPVTIYSQVSLYGSKGLLRIFEAETIHPGQLAINPVYTGYAAGDNYNFSEDHTLNLALTLSLSEQIEVFAHLVPYQDDQKHTWGPIGDTRLSVKYHIPNYGSISQLGFVGFVSLPTAVNHNVDFEPFSDDAIGWGLLGLATFDLKKYFGTLPLKLSLNLGYRDINWSDPFFSDPKDQLIGGFGFKFPVRSNLLYSEVTGEVFFNNIENVRLSQNYVRFTQGFRFVGPWHLICDISGDIELSNYDQNTLNSVNKRFIKDYADWKIIFGVSYRTNVFTGKTRREKELEKRKLEEQKDLDTIQEKRKKVIDDLEELRKKLEQEKKPTAD